MTTQKETSGTLVDIDLDKLREGASELDKLAESLEGEATHTSLPIKVKVRPVTDSESEPSPNDLPNADNVRLFELTAEAQAEGFLTTANKILADKQELEDKLEASHLAVNNLLDNLNVKEL